MIAEYYYLYEDRTWDDGHFFIVPEEIMAYGEKINTYEECVTADQLVSWWLTRYGGLAAYRKVIAVVLAETNMDDRSPWFNPDDQPYTLENINDVFESSDTPS